MAIQLTQEIDLLREMAEGSRPFVVDRILEAMSERVLTPAFKKMSPQDRLRLGYYLAAKRRVEMLSEGRE